MPPCRLDQGKPLLIGGEAEFATPLERQVGAVVVSPLEDAEQDVTPLEGVLRSGGGW